MGGFNIRGGAHKCFDIFCTWVVRNGIELTQISVITQDVLRVGQIEGCGRDSVGSVGMPHLLGTIKLGNIADPYQIP